LYFKSKFYTKNI